MFNSILSYSMILWSVTTTTVLDITSFERKIQKNCLNSYYNVYCVKQPLYKRASSGGQPDIFGIKLWGWTEARHMVVYPDRIWSEADLRSMTGPVAAESFVPRILFQSFFPLYFYVLTSGMKFQEVWFYLCILFIFMHKPSSFIIWLLPFATPESFYGLNKYNFEVRYFHSFILCYFYHLLLWMNILKLLDLFKSSEPHASEPQNTLALSISNHFFNASLLSLTFVES